MTIRNLDSLFKPDKIALICGGGNRDEIIAHNLMSGGFKGPIMPVDPKRWALEGALAYRHIADLPLPPALAIIARPLPEVPTLIQQLGERGTRAAVLVNDARDLPPQQRKALFQIILDAAQPYLLRVLGPGSQGLTVPQSNLNISLSHQALLPGQVALITESGTIGQTALDIGNHYGFGFSHLIHLGESLDIDLADILDYLAGDYRVQAILLYLEQIGDARKFMSAARRAARTKPVIVLKPCRFPKEPDDAVYAAAFRRAGLLRVDDSDELLQMVKVLKAAKLVNNDRLALLSNSSSMSLLATDTLYQFGGRLAQLSEATQQGLESLTGPDALPNPVDLGDEAGAAAYSRALDLLIADPGVDGILVIKTPSAVSDATAVADVMIEGGGEFFHGYTYAGHPTCCAVAERNIRILRDEQIVQRVHDDTGPYLQRRWRELADHPLVGEARGIGFIGALELVKNKETRERFAPLGDVGTLCRDFCFANGLVMRAVWDTMIISPPLVMTHAEIDELVKRARHCLDLTAKQLGVMR